MDDIKKGKLRDGGGEKEKRRGKEKGKQEKQLERPMLINHFH